MCRTKIIAWCTKILRVVDKQIFQKEFTHSCEGTDSLFLAEALIVN